MRLAKFVVLLVFCLRAALAAAATVDVAVGPGLTFDPPSVTIAPGDTVRWTFSGFHTSTSDASSGAEVWDSGYLASGTFSHTFTTAGDYPYYCALHSTPGGTAMNAVVHVIAAPAVTITAVTPPSAAAGTLVTISGGGFQSGASVAFRGVGSANVAFVNSTTLTATVPNIAPGAATVVVTNPDDSTASFAGFAVIAAAVPLLSPVALVLLALAMAAAAFVALR